MRVSVKAILKELLPPLALLIALTCIIAATGADMALEKCFYIPDSGWIYSDITPWNYLYHYGVLPSLAIAVTSFLLLVASLFSARAYIYRKCALFFLLLMLLGPGLLVNTVLKEHWGRPRPRQMQIFGGDRVYHHVWERGESGKGVSFPSGHASAAFYLIAPYFVLRRRSRRWANVILVAGIAYGLFMGVARMVQGGHFLSDVLWAGGAVYLVGLLLYYLLGLHREVFLVPKEQPLHSEPQLTE